MDRFFARPKVTAVLGPTNTGKTYLAIERMLGHRSGMIGFPLRLLARENYERVCKVRGADQVALITGEERIVPAKPRYFLCTVEAMPLDRRVAFLAVDEIQLCADPERGHVFTNRLLEARGDQETMFLGAETIKPMIARLLPETEFIARNRMSRLSYSGPKKLTRLPRRSAVVGFSASSVYGLAEMLRRQRGGTAVVLGALSPRTRNAQVAMYEAGEVDYLVATDAIGMGLNMAIDHVAFSALTKFDGHHPRHLSAAEIAQIAGRAGRHMADGTFGTTNELPGLDPQLVEALEEHRFDRLKYLFWRSSDLEFSSIEALRRSLAAPSPMRALKRARAANDLVALSTLQEDETVRGLAAGRDSVRLLWDVCQVPDFRKELGDGHARLVGRIFKHLMSGDGVLPVDWVARSISRLDRTDGDIDTLVGRIAHIRTWTYISHRGDWLEDSAHWQGQARALEDKLSDALHDRLTQRFVDRRAAALVSRISAGETLLGAVTRSGSVVVEGASVGQLAGFCFVADDGMLEQAGPVRAAANRVLREAIGPLLARFSGDGDEAFALTQSGELQWHGQTVACLQAGARPLQPEIQVAASDLLDRQGREAVRRRLSRWLECHIAGAMAPLLALQAAPLTGPARGLAFQLLEGLGTVAVSAARDQSAALSRRDRQNLARLGVRFGIETIFMPAMLKLAPVALRAILAAVYAQLAPTARDGGRTSMPVDEAWPNSYYLRVGYRPAGPIAVRVDMLERLLAEVRKGLKQAQPYLVPPGRMTAIGASVGVLAEVLWACGFRANAEEAGVSVAARRRGNGSGKGARPHNRGPKAAAPGADSPFAKLAVLQDAR